MIRLVVGSDKPTWLGKHLIPRSLMSSRLMMEMNMEKLLPQDTAGTSEWT